MERVLELAHIAANKNTVPGDTSALVPGGLRMGSPALTSRGFIERDFEQVCAVQDPAQSPACYSLFSHVQHSLQPPQVAEFVHRAVGIAIDLKKKTGSKLKDFRDALAKEVSWQLLGTSRAYQVYQVLFIRHLTSVSSSLQVPAELKALKADVEAFAMRFPTIGFEKAAMRYKN